MSILDRLEYSDQVHAIDVLLAAIGTGEDAGLPRLAWCIDTTGLVSGYVQTRHPYDGGAEDTYTRWAEALQITDTTDAPSRNCGCRVGSNIDNRIHLILVETCRKH